MFLKSIELNGFKSFAHPVKVNFVEGLTVVVGPNGSGKSNINDAFKWVLGEQSKKSLRATTADEMIFAGSEKEKPSDFAEVTLTFDNSDNILNIDFKEVEITRRAYRNQELSEYYINKSIVRRKDIRNLFLDTGLGNIDLAVISQGSVTKITEARPEEMRELLNEAAGVARYQSQKDEALRKLERVDQSLKIFEVKLGDLEKQIKPLEAQKQKAKEYIKLRDELVNIELPLFKKTLLLEIKTKDELTEIISKHNSTKLFTSEKLESISTKIRDNQEKVLEFDKRLYSLQLQQNEAQKMEQQSFLSNDKSDIVEKNIKQNVTALNDIENLLKNNIENNSQSNSEINLLTSQKETLLHEKEKLNHRFYALEYELNKLKDRSYGDLEKGARAVIENKNTFNKVYGIVSDLIKYDSQFDAAIKVGIKSHLNDIVVSDEKCIKDILTFLKTNKFGTATMIPALQVLGKIIPADILMVISKQEGFKGTIASNITTHENFINTIKHIGGNILIFDNYENALAASKITNYRFKMVTLEGDVIYPGFVVRGGHNELKNSRVYQENLERELNSLKKTIESTVTEFNSITSKEEQVKTMVSEIEKDFVRLTERNEYLKTTLLNNLNTYKSLTGSEYDLSKIKSSPEAEFTHEHSLESISQKLKSIQDSRITISKENIDLQKQEEVLRKQWQVSIETITTSQIELDRLTTKIDNQLFNLSKDYKLTLEALLEKNDIPDLKLDVKVAEEKVNELRSSINSLGFINVEAIEQYEELSKDYVSLKTSTIDLRDSKDKLVSTISTLDKEMLERFTTTFDKVNIELEKTFQTLFRGGTAKLKYTTPEDVLNSGIEFTGQTPGKIVQSIKLYSGGERSMMALALIFAINDVKKLPLLILDEVEAALDEANVDRFAKYAKQVNDASTQVIITSHRPGTMEMADILYGVTIQEKGISKIVSVKLEEAIEMAQ